MRLAADPVLLMVGYPRFEELPGVLQAEAPLPARRSHGLGSDPGWTAMLRQLGLKSASERRADHADLFRTLPPGGRARLMTALRRWRGGSGSSPDHK